MTVLWKADSIPSHCMYSVVYECLMLVM